MHRKVQIERPGIRRGEMSHCLAASLDLDFPDAILDQIACKDVLALKHIAKLPSFRAVRCDWGYHPNRWSQWCRVDQVASERGSLVAASFQLRLPVFAIC